MIFVKPVELQGKVDAQFKYHKCINIINNRGWGPQNYPTTILIMFTWNHLNESRMEAEKIIFFSNFDDSIFIKTVQLYNEKGGGFKNQMWN